MSTNSNAEASAIKSGISTLGAAASTTHPAANNSRGSEVQGNTYLKKLIRDLSPDDRETLVEPVLHAMESDDNQLEGYFLDPLYNLFAEGEANEVYMHKLFVKSLMIMALKPKNARLLQKNFGREGYKYFEKLYSFFDSLEDDGVQKWADYITLSKYSGSVTVGQVQAMAKAYIPVKKPGTEIVFDLNRIVHQPLAFDPEPEEKAFKLTDEQLVDALDRYFPSQTWPGSKKSVATHDRMRAHLTAREEERLSIQSETPEQKEKRLVADAVYSAVNGPNIPQRLSSIERAINGGDFLLAEALEAARQGKKAAEQRYQAAKNSTSATKAPRNAVKPAAVATAPAKKTSKPAAKKKA